MYSSTGRLRAIQLPCCCSIPHRGAAAIVSLGGAILYGAWLGTLWRTGAKLLDLATSTTSAVDLVAITFLRSLVGVGMYLALTIVALFLGVLFSCALPHRDVLKHLSRLLWIGWCGTWIVGVIGVVAFVSGDLPFTAECTAASWSTDCTSWWGQVQAWVVACVFITLLLHFYLSLVVSSYTHTLHPHLFFQDEDSEDDDLLSDSDDEKFPPALAAGRPRVDVDSLRRRSMASRRSGEHDYPPSYQGGIQGEIPHYEDKMYGSSESGSELEDEDEEAGRRAEVRLLRTQERQAQGQQVSDRRRLEEEYSGDEGSEEDSSDGEDESALRGRERVGRLAERERRTLL